MSRLNTKTELLREFLDKTAGHSLLKGTKLLNLHKNLEKLFNSDSSVRLKFSQNFFYANLCQVCHRNAKDSTLKRCSACKMIYYCSKTHQVEHFPVHKEFCRAAATLQKGVVGSSFFSILREFGEEDNWNWKMAIINLMEKYLKRKLIPFEKEMILYPKACLECQETDVDVLKSCDNCPHANFCQKHRNTDHEEGKCTLYSFSCIVDCYSLLPSKSREKEILRDISNVMKVFKYNEKTPLSMAEFVASFYDIYIHVQPNSDIIFAQVSDYFTQPLTLFYALKKLNYPDKKEIVIHVIGSTLSELDNCLSWDILLHWMNTLDVLTVVLIGPDCQDTKSISVSCRECKFRGKNVQVLCYNGLYTDFYHSHLFKKPDVMMGFHLAFFGGDAWKESLLMLSKLKCPLVLTIFKWRMEKDHKRLCEYFDKNIRHVFKGDNPFKGYSPQRDPGAGGFLFKNGLVAIYDEFWGNPDVNHPI
ncbi:uncharacterized protein LOC117168401 [Belonocnema kinseyi]|uniref:uncharacterized protein LOC117168401 n=1 Tax=Belonocnema kinseyi TaxID=2817044 RepID=UPI00143DDB11|nr:uncharacterized protein LOC117168401 [Belonocnema kinseyi]